MENTSGADQCNAQSPDIMERAIGIPREDPPHQIDEPMPVVGWAALANGLCVLCQCSASTALAVASCFYNLALTLEIRHVDLDFLSDWAQLRKDLPRDDLIFI